MMIINGTSYRDKSYSDTFEILNQYRKLAGITRLADITHLDYTGLPVYAAIRPRAKSLSTSQGKGLTADAAKCSALMEAIEVYFAENITPEVRNFSVYDLDQEHVPYVHPNDLNNRVIYTNDDEPLNWVKTTSVSSGKSILAPFAEFSLDTYLKEVLVYSPGSTGLSGGNTYNEALLHSLLEVIEREPSNSDLEVINTESKLVDKVSVYFECKIFYKKNCYGIPSFEVLLKSKNPYDNQVFFKGNGCHLNKQIALHRALTEAIQSRVTIIAGSRDDILNSKYDGSDVTWFVDTNQCNFRDLQDYRTHDIKSGLSFIFEKILKNNQDILVYKYFEEDICVLKSKIILTDNIKNV